MKLDRATSGLRRRNPSRVGRCLIATIAVGLTVGATACSSSSDDDASGETITITDARGDQELMLRPERVVALDNQWIDSVLALDETPVGYLDNLEVVAGAAPPWHEGALDDATELKFTDDLIEKVGELAPDLILIPNYLITDDQYNKLKSIAPTLSALTPGAGVDAWDQRVEVLGKVFDKEDKADEVVASVNDKLDGLAAKYPKLQGKTFITAYLVGSQITVLGDPEDGSAKIFERLGLSIPQHIVDIKGPTGRPTLSSERIGELDSDIIFAATNNPDQNAFAALPGYDALPAVQSGSVYVASLTTITGLNQPTPLALPYALDEIEPTLANAAK